MNPIVNPGDKRRRSSAYREELKRRSLDRLIGADYSIQGHQFIINDAVAERMADALAAKNPGMMKQALGESVEIACATSMEVPLDTYSDEWNEALSLVSGREVTLIELLTSGEKQNIGLLKQALQDSREHQLALETDSYVRLLHTVALATIPDEGYKDRLTTNHNERKKISSIGIHATAMNILNEMASQEPGIRKIRESILDDSQTLPIDNYLTRLQLSLTSQLALAHIIDLQDTESVLAAREQILSELGAVERTDYEEELATHLLTWEILPHKNESEEDATDIICVLKKRGKSLAKTRKARDRFEQRWDASRLESLLAIARQEAEKGRHVEIYISSAFNNSQEFYVAIEYTHPENNDAKIVVADNPMTGNALYLVDEEHTNKDENGQNFGWRFVLGASKKIARLRGAKRRFHVGEWAQITEEFCKKGVGKTAIKAADVTKANPDDVEADAVDSILSQPDVPASTDQSVTEHIPTTNMNDVLKRIAEIRSKIDEVHKQIIDKKQ